MVLQGAGLDALGYGFFGKVTSTDNIPTMLKHSYLASFKLQIENTVTELMGMKGGESQIIDFLSTKTVPTVTSSVELLDKEVLEMLLNEKFVTTSSYTGLDGSGFGISEEAQFNSVGEISGTTLTTAFTGKTPADVLVTLIGNGTNDEGPLTVVTGSAAADTTEVEINATTNKLINTDLAGRGVIISVKKTVSNMLTNGYASAKQELGKLDFVGVFSGPRFKHGLLVVVQGLRNTQGFTLDASESKNAVELQMKAATPPGKRKAVHWGILPDLYD